MDYKILEKDYNNLAKKYKLPSFTELNEIFEIDKIEKETQFTLRTIRKTMMEKIVNTLSFFEMLINPINLPRIYMPYLKSVNQEDKKTIEKLYIILGGMSLKVLKLEVGYDEKAEAIAILEVFSNWKSISPELKSIMARFSIEPSQASKKERTYFG